jgi:hypothetical protein
MKLPKNCKIEAVASTDPTREVLTAPYLEVKKGSGTLIATNGRALVALPVEVSEEDTEGWVAIPALVAARKFARKGTDAEVTCNGACAAMDGVAYPRPFTKPANPGPDYIAKRFPNWRMVVPDEGRRLVLRVSLDPTLLMAMANALGSGEQITLEFEDELAPIRVTGKGEGFGVLMPMRTT